MRQGEAWPIAARHGDRVVNRGKGDYPDLVIFVSSVSKGIVGGVLEYLNPLQRLLPRHQIAAKTLLYPRTLNLMEGRGLPKFARVWLHLAFILICLVRIVSLSRHNRLVLVHTHGASYALLVGYFAKVLGHPALHTFHSTKPRESTTLRLIARRLDGLVFVSKSLEKEYRESAGVGNEAIHYIPGAVDVTAFQPAEGAEKDELRRSFLSRYGLPDRGTLVVFLGRIAPEKGVLELIEAIAVLRKRQYPTSAILVGPSVGSSQAYRRQLEASILALGLREWVVLGGPVAPPAKMRLMAAADVFVCPSRGEGSPISVVEALASGVPVVGTRVGGLVEQIPDGEVGLLVSDLTPERLADAIGSLLTSKSDRLRMAHKGRERAIALFGENVFLEKHLALYASTLHRSTKDRRARDANQSASSS